MSGTRHTNWLHVKAKGPHRPDLISFGRKLLGYLDNQRRLSGVTSLDITRYMSDGSIVRARWVDEVPIIDIVAMSSGGGIKTEVTLLTGIVVKPRGYAGFNVGQGQDKFGTYSHKILNAAADAQGGVTWTVYYYDQTYFPSTEPEPIYTLTPEGEVLFPEGLLYIPRRVWVDKTENICIGWHAQNHQQAASEDNDHSFDIWRNGQQIFTYSSWSWQSGIRGACVRVFEGNPYLVYIIGGYSPTFSIYRHLIEPLDTFAYKWLKDSNEPIDVLLHPRWKVMAHATAELIYTQPHPGTGANEWGNNEPYGCLVFNQSATELRGIRHAHGDINNANFVRAYELVVSLPSLAPSTGTYTYTEVGMDGFVTTTNTTGISLLANGYNAEIPVVLNPLPGSFTDGTWVYNYEYKYRLIEPLANSQSSTFSSDWSDALVGAVTGTITQTPRNSAPIKLTVGYEDDVPVYCYWQRGTASTTASYNTNGLVHTPTDKVLSSYVVKSGGATTESYSETEVTQAVSYTGSGSASGTTAPFRVWAVDKNGITWFDESVVGSTSSTTEVSFIANYYKHGTSHFISGAGTTSTSNTSGSVTGEYSQVRTATGGALSISHLDFATRSAMAYRRYELYENSNGRTVTGQYLANTDTTAPCTVTNTGTGTTTYTLDTRCYVYGEQVFSHSETFVRNTPPSVSPPQTLYLTLSNPREYAYLLLAAPTTPALTPSTNDAYRAVANNEVRIHVRSDSIPWANGITPLVDAVVNPWLVNTSTPYSLDTTISVPDYSKTAGGRDSAAYHTFPVLTSGRQLELMGVYANQATTTTQPAPANFHNNRSSMDSRGQLFAFRGVWTACVPYGTATSLFSPFSRHWKNIAGVRGVVGTFDLDQLSNGVGGTGNESTIYAPMWPISSAVMRIKNTDVV